MAQITLTEAQSFYTQAKTAYISALGGDTYTISTGGSSRSFKRQSIKELKEQMEYWASEVDRLSLTDTGMKIRHGFAI